jgi:hypothetical protein
MLVCANKHNRCKQIVIPFIVASIDLLVVGWVIVFGLKRKKVTVGSRNSVMRLGTGFVVHQLFREIVWWKMDDGV